MICLMAPFYLLFFFFNDTATTEIYTLSLHDALPISFCAGLLLGRRAQVLDRAGRVQHLGRLCRRHHPEPDRKSTRLNSSHSQISYAVFCLKKKSASGGAGAAAVPHRVRSRRVNRGGV